MTVSFLIEQNNVPSLCLGLDEVGCAPLAGPVVSACVYVPQKLWTHERMERVRDSKKVPKKERETLSAWLCDTISFGIGEASVDDIDTLNILQASKLAMRRAFDNCPKPDGALIALCDGHAPRKPDLPIDTRMIKGGDNVCRSIAAASIIAKVYRDTLMATLAQDFPQYGWHSNVGYPSKLHLDALREFGATVHHRRSFAPVRAVLEAAA